MTAMLVSKEVTTDDKAEAMVILAAGPDGSSARILKNPAGSGLEINTVAFKANVNIRLESSLSKWQCGFIEMFLKRLL